MKRVYYAARGQHIRDEFLLGPGARRGPLTMAYELANTIPGYFTYEDCTSFWLVLRIQTPGWSEG